MNKYNTFFEYLRTISLTILITFIVLLIAMAFTQHYSYEEAAIKEAQDDSMEYYLVGLLIEKNKYLEIKEPKNYNINVKLGMLYEIYKDPKNAEAQYKTAIEKSPYNEYKPISKLAKFYISQNKLEEAQKLMDELGEKPDKKLIKAKGEIYYRLGEKYYNSGDYLEAINKYQKSLFYYERIHSKKITTLKNSLASAYVYLAENYVDELKIEEAIESLMTASTYVDAPIIKYKLAILLIKNDPLMAYKYFEEVVKKEPSIINFDVYYNFLTTMSQAAASVGAMGESELYTYKAKKFKEYYQDNVLSVDDLKIETAEGKMTVNRWRKKCNLNLRFQLKNTSKDNLNSLFVYVIFKDKNETIAEYSNKIVDVKKPLKSGSIGPIINLKSFKKLDDFEQIPNYVVAELYVSKTEKSYRINLMTIPIENKTKEAKWLRQIRQFFLKLYLRA